jgi:hypothetical protein
MGTRSPKKNKCRPHQAASSRRTLHFCRIGPEALTTVLSKSVGERNALVLMLQEL